MRLLEDMMTSAQEAIKAWDNCQNSADVQRVSGLSEIAKGDFDKLYKAPLLREGQRLSDGTYAVSVQVPGGFIRVCLEVTDGIVSIASQSGSMTANVL